MPLHRIVTTQSNRIIPFIAIHSSHKTCLFHFVYFSGTWAETVTPMSTEHTSSASVSQVTGHQA